MVGEILKLKCEGSQYKRGKQNQRSRFFVVKRFFLYTFSENICFSRLFNNGYNSTACFCRVSSVSSFLTSE